MGRQARVPVFAILVALLAGCGPGAVNPSPTPIVATPTVQAAPTVAPTPDLANPVGIVAVGHSGLTGEGTAGPLVENKRASWATGSLPEVNSIYLRLVAVVPGTKDRVVNTARGGASANALLSQAETALRFVPVPLLAIVQTVDNDIQCEGANVTQVGEHLLTALEAIHGASPNTRILVVGQPGRPSIAYITELVTQVPAAKAGMTWADDCSFFDAEGNLREEGVAKLTAAIDAYEAETARVCSLVPNCSTDGGVRRTWVDRMEYYASDWAHFNTQGQAAQAEQLWPVVAEILGL